MKNLNLVLFILIFGFTNLLGQETYSEGEKVTIYMKDGNIFRGVVSVQTDNELTLTSNKTLINLQKDEIRRVEQDVYEGKFAYRNSQDTRYFYSPTGIPIKKGKGYYQNIMLTSNFANYGVTKNFSVGGGFEFLTLFSGVGGLYSFNTKFGFKITDDLHGGVGTLSLGILGEEMVTLGYGVLTFGNSDNNLTIGSGAVIRKPGPGESNQVIPINISGIRRISDRVSLVSENYFIQSTGDYGGEKLFSETIYIGIHGVRLMARRSAFDIGLIVVPAITQDFSIPGIPYVGYAFSF